MKPKSIQGKFRMENGFVDGHRCKECSKCVAVNVGKRTVYKCTEIGLSGSEATDIRLKNMACKLFTPKEGD